MEFKKEDTIIGIWLFVLFISFFLDKFFLKAVLEIKNNYLDYFMSAISNSFSVVFILVVVTSLFLYEEKKREWIPVLLFSFFFSFIAAFLLKIIIARPRPFFEILFPFFNIVDYSFPSAHATVAFSVLPVLEREFKLIKWFWILLAVLIAFSRLYLGVHYLSDVIGGALLGYLIGHFIVTAEEKYHILKLK